LVKGYFYTQVSELTHSSTGGTRSQESSNVSHGFHYESIEN